LETQNQKYRESTIEMKAEIERLKTKMIEYDLKDQQYKIELDTKKI
jgi:phage shock protein A